MKETASYIFRSLYPLVVIAVVVGALLGLTYQLLEDKIIEAQNNEELLAVKSAMPYAADLKKEYLVTGTNSNSYYIAYDRDNAVMGYIFKGSKKGYGGNVVTLTSITNGITAGFVIADMRNETPGLGTKIADTEWLSQFKGKSVDYLPWSKQDFKARILTNILTNAVTNGRAVVLNEVTNITQLRFDAVAGATYSSLAVTRGIKEAYSYYQAVTALQNPAVATNVSTNQNTVTTNITTNAPKADSYSGASSGGK